MTDKPTRRALMRPVQLLGLAFAAAVFAGVVTLISLGFFQSRFTGQGMHALEAGGVVAGITFIVVLVTIALLILAVDPAQMGKTIDRPVLLPRDDTDASGTSGDDGAPAQDGTPPDLGAEP